MHDGRVWVRICHGGQGETVERQFAKVKFHLLQIRHDASRNGYLAASGLFLTS